MFRDRRVLRVRERDRAKTKARAARLRVQRRFREESVDEERFDFAARDLDRRAAREEARPRV